MTVGEMLQLADIIRSSDNPSRSAYELARAVIELLETPLPDGFVDTVLPATLIGETRGIYLVAPDYQTPAEARGLAVALLKAADDAERR